MNFAVVILAAGASARMGRPKLLLPWRNKTVLAHLVESWRALGASQIVAVTAPAQQNPLAAELDRLGLGDRIENPHPSDGMFSSVRCAASWRGWKQEITHVLLTLGDQPHVQPDTFRALLDLGALHPEKICQPARRGRPRHPVLMPRAIFSELVRSPAENLKQFLIAREAQRATFESSDEALDFDLDEPADYERALHMATVV